MSVITEALSTFGDFQDEPASMAAFDDIAEKSGAFTIYREVWGEYLQPRFGTECTTEEKACRIDRVLVPTKKLIAAGWKNSGAIGVEGKKSGKKAGPLICQALGTNAISVTASGILQAKDLPMGKKVGSQ